MECAGNRRFDSYTRYRSSAVVALPAVSRRVSLERAALLVLVAAIWGYVLYQILQAAL